MPHPAQPGENSLAGRRILVTGAASGIGRATAIQFAREGAKVALLDRDEKGLAEVAQATGGFATACDITREKDVEEAIARAAEALGGLDGLVHAAGIGYSANLLDTSPEDWRRVIEVNLTGPFLVCRAAVTHLQKQASATIVTLASGIGVRAAVKRAAYGSSKAGVISLSRVMAQELGPKIRVNVVCPGLVDTPMVRATRPSEEAMAKTTSQYALKRFGQPQEISEAILFLTSDRSSFVTGSVVMVDGGQ
jgi:NAD(P)-dependent dehydrogenase (short-subunit alcohol dehydrogenase family)